MTCLRLRTASPVPMNLKSRLSELMDIFTLQKTWFPFCKKHRSKVKSLECSVIFSVMLFSLISAKEIIFVLSSIVVLVCNLTFLKSNMTFVKSMIHIIEWMCYELLYTQVVVLVKIGRVLFSYYMYFFTLLIVCRAWDFCIVTFTFWD